MQLGTQEPGTNTASHGSRPQPQRKEQSPVPQLQPLKPLVLHRVLSSHTMQTAKEEITTLNVPSVVTQKHVCPISFGKVLILCYCKIIRRKRESERNKEKKGKERLGEKIER